MGSQVLDKENEMNTVFYFHRSPSGNVYTMHTNNRQIFFGLPLASCGWEILNASKLFLKGDPCSIKSWNVPIPFSEDPEEHDRIKNELFGIICQKFKELDYRGGMRPGDTLEMHLELNESFVGS